MPVTRAVDVNRRTVTPSSEELFVQELGEVACAHLETRTSLSLVEGVPGQSPSTFVSTTGQ